MPATIAEIMGELDALAPPYLCLENDPRGLLIGDPRTETSVVVVALDVTLGTVRVAEEAGARMIIAHHPLVYHPLKTVREDEPHPGAVVMACIRAGVSVACAHTNWDVAGGGVNDILADLVGMERNGRKPLKITWRESLVKIVVYAPPPYREALMDAMANAGAGAMGDYDRCAFWTEGVGTFRPLEGAHPFVGTVNQAELVREERLEMIAPEALAPAIVAAMRTAHPYEEPAHEAYPLANTGRALGLGRVGRLSEPTTAAGLAARVRDALHFGAVRMTAPSGDARVETVAVCGGAGASLAREAFAPSGGADAYITSDIAHHEFVDAQARGVILLDAGHRATEEPGARALADAMRRRLAERSVDVAFVDAAQTEF